MDDVLVVEILDSSHDLFEEVVGLFFCKFSALLEVTIKVRVAQLSHNVHVIASLKHIKEFDYIFMVDFLHDFDLRLYVFSVEVVGKKPFVNDFHSNCFTSLDDFATID
jgi:hypothetical protein